MDRRSKLSSSFSAQTRAAANAISLERHANFVKSRSLVCLFAWPHFFGGGREGAGPIAYFDPMPDGAREARGIWGGTGKGGRRGGGGRGMPCAAGETKF